MGLVKLVRENFHRLIAFTAFAGEGLQVLEILEAGTMLGCRHDFLLLRLDCFWFKNPALQGPANLEQWPCRVHLFSLPAI
jgi:hypothetical protein